MSSIKGTDTKNELMLHKALWKEGVRGYRKIIKGRTKIQSLYQSEIFPWDHLGN